MPGYFKYSRLIIVCGNCNFCQQILLCALLFVTYTTNAQRGKIDSLKTLFPTLHDTAQVDCLNTLGLVYSYLEVDTAVAYTDRAQRDARKLGYLRGVAMASNTQAHIAGYIQRNFRLQERISLETISNTMQLKDKRVIGETFMNLALALFCQGKFDQSAAACKSIIEIAGQAADKKLLGEALAILGSINFERGNYEKSFENFNESLAVFIQSNDSFNSAILTAKIGDLYRLAGDNDAAITFYSKSLEYPQGSSLVWHPLVDLGDTYYSPERLDTTAYAKDKYIQTIKTLTIRSNNPTLARTQESEMDIASGRYDHAIKKLNHELAVAMSSGDKNLAMRILLDLGRAYAGRREYQLAFASTWNLLGQARFHKAKQYIRDGCKLMVAMHHQLGQTDSAYFYLRNYAAMKDSVAQDDFVRKLALYKAVAEVEKNQAQIQRLKDDKIINEQRLKLAQQELNRESILTTILVIGALVLFILGFVILRNVRLQQKNEANEHELVKQELNLQRIESDQIRSDLQRQAVELEMKALRAQMNPHFIFNSLNAINRFILQNDKMQASEYLTKFSKLVRLILQNSQLAMITLESELEALYLYLELEALRFDNHFEYKVEVEQGLDCSAVKVPPLIIQPYVENAIWHGMMHKDEKGHLHIELSLKEHLLYCRITDDGIGRKRAKDLKSKSASKHKSMGMRITEDRIALLQPENKLESYVTITDLVLANNNPGGTEVLLKIPIPL